jgi:hypothetical protein
MHGRKPEHQHRGVRTAVRNGRVAKNHERINAGNVKLKWQRRKRKAARGVTV